MKLYQLALITVISHFGIVSFANSSCIGDDTGFCELGLSVFQPWCWGYEANCSFDEQLFNRPLCEGSPKPWVNTMEEKIEKFWRQADFGYIQDFLSTISDFCVPRKSHQGHLKCSTNMRYCHSRNLVLDFKEYNFDTRDRFLEDIAERVVIGGDCIVESDKIDMNGQQGGALQSWHRELRKFKTMSMGHNCDVTIERPVVFMKLDAGVNMYHHFCDFVNLYASQHLNRSFSRDVELIRWDTGTLYYQDLFKSVWKVFTSHAIRSLSEFSGKIVCFKEAMFSLPPRMYYGLFYNMPLVPQCYGSGLMKAFSRHTLSRLNIKHRPLDKQVQVTLVPRNTKFRNILNQEELISALNTVGAINLTVIEYNPRHMSFIQQLDQTYNSDVFITMHGAGLTHLLFLPDWGSVIELYNCDDAACYRDLAAIRGVKYFTWEESEALFPQDEGHHPSLGAHKKFTNYSFKLEAFLKLVLKAVDYIIQHKPTVSHHIHTEL
ncbi:hypothetical protein LOD99_7665 [Oopsacas minuta]|uniref:EGF domain-specific O-linked N-acetylglucosamine transferase n=1 Tax=Oopsacas minuta TaxID=111878 RepID=A0AAV7JQK4_9METZ|nr:hypothetical protein LOD99_7665 [Oopsacas minuta]